MCYRTENTLFAGVRKHPVCRRVRASLSPEMLQSGSVKGLSYRLLVQRLEVQKSLSDSACATNGRTLNALKKASWGWPQWIVSSSYIFCLRFLWFHYTCACCRDKYIYAENVYIIKEEEKIKKKNDC